MRVTDPAGPLQSDNAVTVGGEGAGWKQANEQSLRKRGLNRKNSPAPLDYWRRDKERVTEIELK